MSNDAPSFEARDRYKMIVSHIRNRYLEKEKQFGFDCFEAGMQYGMDICASIDWGDNPIKPNFKQFYSQYTQQKQ